MRVYWVTPLGKALNEAIEEMNLPEELEKKIKPEFEKAIEHQFNANDKQTSNKAALRLKFNGSCKTYNNVYRVWNFNIEKFKTDCFKGDFNTECLNMESEAECKLISTPHMDYGERDAQAQKKAK